MKLPDPVSIIPKVGPKYTKLLKKLEIATVEDLLYHFPFRYDDFSVVKEIKDLFLGDTASVKGVLTQIDNIYTKNRKRLTRAKIEDQTGRLEVIWFNQHYLKRVLSIGKTYMFSGKIDNFSGKLILMSPEYEEDTGIFINTARFVPIYPETAGISSKWLRSRINDVIGVVGRLEEFLPEITLKNQALIPFAKALKQFHFPNNQKDIDQARERFSFEELFLELLRVESRKKEWEQNLKGMPLEVEKYRKEIDYLLKSLPFELTNSQERALEEILSDFQKEHPMNRLLEGDVGTGKTIVAIIGAYATHLNGLQTLYMAPTEILANQHFATFKEILEPLGVKIALKTASAPKSKDLSKDADITIGTHALLYKKGKIGNVGFIVIDEQHRFGVEQRAKIVELSSKDKVPHLLTMTATPIPRTLALTIYGDLAISTLEPIPTKTKEITTWIVGRNKRDEAYEWIRKQNASTFIVCPLIEESEHESMAAIKAAQAEFASLKKGIFSKVEMGLLHGRLKAKEKQEVVERFRSGEIKVLVSTPVIEVGMDIPEAKIMVVESAERYGLASLHQLRGRVGRKGGQAYCLLIPSSPSKDAIYRLRYLEKINNGLRLAEIDMHLRGQGDIYGTSQHGFIKFKVANLSDLKMLERAKSEAKNIFPDLKGFPLLTQKLEMRNSSLVGQN